MVRRARVEKKLEDARSIGPLAIMESPPDNMAFMAETDLILISKAGFVGELLILFATSKGLSTCANAGTD